MLFDIEHILLYTTVVCNKIEYQLYFWCNKLYMGTQIDLIILGFIVI